MNNTYYHIQLMYCVADNSIRVALPGTPDVSDPITELTLNAIRAGMMQCKSIHDKRLEMVKKHV